MIEILTWSGLALAAASGLFAIVLALRRLQLGREERRRSELETRLRPLALALVEGETVERAPLSEAEAQVLAEFVARYARLLRGDARSHVAAFFESGGHVDQAIAALSTRRAPQRARAASPSSAPPRLPRSARSATGARPLLFSSRPAPTTTGRRTPPPAP
jgi:hypothetical protein